jgi:hypothetical protein
MATALIGLTMAVLATAVLAAMARANRVVAGQTGP